MKLALYRDSRTGGRSYNQDRMAVAHSRDAVLLVVADGMGGHLMGEVAAQITVDLMTELFYQHATPLLAYPNRFLVNAVSSAHHAILDYAIQKRLPEVPSTTVVACVIQQYMMYWCYAGDSRLYLLDSDGAVRMRSRDHSHVQRLIDQGVITEAEARVHPDRNKIYNCLGAGGEPDIDVGERQPISTGMSVVLCSDGLWSQVNDGEWGKVFAGRSVSQVMPALMNVAERRGGAHGDNLTGLGITLLDDDADTTGRSDILDTSVPSSRLLGGAATITGI